MKKFIGAFVAVMGIIGVVVSSLALTLPTASVVILSILKLTNLVQMDWFAGITELGAISTGLWILFIGIIVYFLSMIFVVLGKMVTDD